MRLLVFGLFFLALACANGGDGGGEMGRGFEGCGDVASNCVMTTSCSTVSCPFDPSEIDCELACETILAVCDGGCASATCAGVVNMELCLQACGLEAQFSCGNATFGCYTLNDTCESIAGCLGCSV